MKLAHHASFVLCGFRVPTANPIGTNARSSRRPFCKFANPVTLRPAFGSGGNGRSFNRRGRDENGWGDGWIPVSHSAALALSSRHRSDVPLVASARGRQTGGFNAWLSQVPATHVLLAANLVIFALQFAYGGRLLAAGAKINSAIAAGEWHRLISPIFLHSSVSHLAVNSYSLYSTGPSVEAWFGRKRFLALYAVSGFSGNMLSFLCSPAPAVGASGAIFGLVGAMAVLLVRHRSILQPRSRAALRSLGFIVLANFSIGMTPGAQIDNFGHLGGLIGGLFFSYVAGPRLSRRRSIAGTTVLVDRPLFLDILADVRERFRKLVGVFK